MSVALHHPWLDGGAGANDREPMPVELALALLRDENFQPGPRPPHFTGEHENSMERRGRIFKEMEVPVPDGQVLKTTRKGAQPYISTCAQ